MAQEWELKFTCDAETCLAVMQDAAVAALVTGWTETPMETTYYDTENRAFSARKWTLRQRKEGARQGVTLKTAGKDNCRGEWEYEAESLQNAAEHLIKLGAPAEAEALLKERLVPVCGAKFLRKAGKLTFSDGSAAELALDEGILFREERKHSFCELELEAKSESKTELKKLAAYLKLRYDLREEPLSKFARAVKL